MPRIVSLLPLVLLAASAAPSAYAQATASKIDFNRDVKPVLSNFCFKCHGPDAAERKGGADGLRLDTADGAAVDLGGYAAIVPGEPDKSALIARITSADPDDAMPPRDRGKKLSPRDIEILTQWIREGAKYAGHWSYVKPTRPPLPAVSDASWPRNGLDYFLLARLDREGLRPSPEADRYALIRRLSLDLTGLPPSVNETDAFVADAGPQAYEK
ncbi:MAG TPA: c-type cytochrome domain-containing protein, partial [Thermomicrobiales bacterium]|nr:c-type cytochrome domain-containing protein [Thermomicrobiales bacterium]